MIIQIPQTGKEKKRIIPSMNMGCKLKKGLKVPKKSFIY
jgi:hypothetical protein